MGLKGPGHETNVDLDTAGVCLVSYPDPPTNKSRKGLDKRA